MTTCHFSIYPSNYTHLCLILFWTLWVSIDEHKGASEMHEHCRCLHITTSFAFGREDSSSLLCHLLWYCVITPQGHSSDAPRSSWILRLLLSPERWDGQFWFLPPGWFWHFTPSGLGDGSILSSTDLQSNHTLTLRCNYRFPKCLSSCVWFCISLQYSIHQCWLSQGNPARSVKTVI